MISLSIIRFCNVLEMLITMSAARGTVVNITSNINCEIFIYIGFNKAAKIDKIKTVFRYQLQENY